MLPTFRKHWNLTRSSFSSISQRNPNSLHPLKHTPPPSPNLSNLFQTPKSQAPPVSFPAEEFKQITSICVQRSPTGKGPKRIYCWQNTNTDFIKHCEQRALILSICPPGAGRTFADSEAASHRRPFIFLRHMLFSICDEEVDGGCSFCYHQWCKMSEKCLCFSRLSTDKATREITTWACQSNGSRFASIGPHLFLASNRRDSRNGTGQKNGGKRKKKKAERKRGITFPVWLTFILSETCISFGSWPETFDLLHVLSRVTRLWPFRQWIHVSGDRSLTKNLHGPYREKLPNQVQLFFTQSSICLQPRSFLNTDLQH